MKRAACLLAALGALLLAAPASAEGYPAPDGYVLDEAGSLGPGVEERLERQLADYDARTTNQVAVALVRTLDGVDPADFGLGLFNAWGIGTAEKDNGVLLLLAVDDRATRIQTGLGVEDLLTDEEAQGVLDDVLAPAARAGNLDAAVLRSVSAIRSQLGEGRGPARRGPARPDPFRGGEAEPVYEDVVQEPTAGGPGDDYPATTYPVSAFPDDDGFPVVFGLVGLGVAVGIVTSVLRGDTGRPSGSGAWFGSSVLDGRSSSRSSWSGVSSGSHGSGSSSGFGGGSSGGGGASGGW